MTPKVTSERILECIVNSAIKNLSLNDDFIVDIEDSEIVATEYLNNYMTSIVRDIAHAENLEELDCVIEHQAMMSIYLTKVFLAYLEEVRRQKQLTKTNEINFEHTFRK